MSCTAEPRAGQAELAKPTEPAPARLALIEVQLVPDRSEDHLVAQLALVTALLEASLSDIAGVAAVVEGAPASPGLAGAISAGKQVQRFAIAVASDAADELDIDVQAVCGAPLCPSLRAHASGDPSVATASIARELSTLIGRRAAPALELGWRRPQSKDRYARLMLGRAAAIHYRLIPEVPPAQKNDRRVDPFERAVFIDPRMWVGQWMSARRRYENKEWAAARSGFGRAGFYAREHVLHQAEEARALAQLGQADLALSSWETVLARTPGDPRFVLSFAEALLAQGRGEDTQKILTELGSAAEADPKVLELRVMLADQTGRGKDDEALLVAWQNAALHDPEPVRRRIFLHVRRHELTAAGALVPLLKERGAAEEAQRFGLALAVSDGRLADAEQAARALNLLEVAEALRLRASIEARTAPAQLEQLARDPFARIAVGVAALEAKNAARALAVADEVLVGEPHLAEAIALRASALAQLGQKAEALKATAQLEREDPELARSLAATSSVTH